MIKPVTVSLCSLVLLTATMSPALNAAGASPTDDAVSEAVRRQAYTIELRQKLEIAQSTEQRRDLVAASKLYEACVELSQKIGSSADPEAQMAVVGLTNIRMELARQAQRVANYKEADIQLRALLRVNPKDNAVLEFKRQNDRLLAEQAGRIPSDEARDILPSIRTNKLDAATLVQDGKLLWEMGRYDEAGAKLSQALKLDPENKGAFYYLSLVQQSQFSRANLRKELDSRSWLVDVEQNWERPVQRELLPKPNPYATNNLVYTGQGRQSIISKLDRIRLNEVKYDGLELSEVIRNISDETRKRDPDKTGINFLIVADSQAPAPAAPAAVDPTTGLPVGAVALAEPLDLRTVRIRIDPALNDVRLADALEAIVNTADRPIKYSIEDYAILFSGKATEPEPLYTRTFKVDPNTFYQGLEGVGAFVFGETSGTSGGGIGGGGGRGGGGGGRGGGGAGGQNQISGAIISRVSAAPGQVQGGQGGGFGGGGGGAGGGGGFRFITTTNSVEEVSAAARNFFTSLGITLTAPKTVFFNDRQGLLLVRATLQDLDLIEAAIQVLCVVPPQINIKAKFLEVGQDDSKALGFDWYLGNTKMADGRIGAQGGSAPSFAGDATHPPFPGPVTPTTITPKETDQLLTSGLRNASSSLFTFTGILTDPQFRLVIHALEQRGGNEVLASPEVTTISGRQAQMKASEVKTVITSFDFNQQVGGGGGAGGFLSDRNLKQDFQPVDPQQVLAKVAALPITEWSYKDDMATRHIGPMAQDFHAAFNVGSDNRQIAVVDVSGVALTAIQGLNEKNAKLEERVKQASAQIESRDAEIKTLKERLDKLEQTLDRLAK